MKKNTLFSLNVGLPTIFLVFIVICLLSFSILSYVTARADWNLCQKAVAHSDAYYSAVNQAENKLADISHGEGAKTTYLFPISDLQSLSVSLSYTKNGNYEISDYKIISTEDIVYDEHLNVIP